MQIRLARLSIKIDLTSSYFKNQASSISPQTPYYTAP